MGHGEHLRILVGGRHDHGIDCGDRTVLHLALPLGRRPAAREAFPSRGLRPRRGARREACATRRGPPVEDGGEPRVLQARGHRRLAPCSRPRALRGLVPYRPGPSRPRGAGAPRRGGGGRVRHREAVARTSKAAVAGVEARAASAFAKAGRIRRQHREGPTTQPKKAAGKVVPAGKKPERRAAAAGKASAKVAKRAGRKAPGPARPAKRKVVKAAPRRPASPARGGKKKAPAGRRR